MHSFFVYATANAYLALIWLGPLAAAVWAATKYTKRKKGLMAILDEVEPKPSGPLDRIEQSERRWRREAQIENRSVWLAIAVALVAYVVAWFLWHNAHAIVRAAVEISRSYDD